MAGNLDFKLRLDAEVRQFIQQMQQAGHTAQAVGKAIENALNVQPNAQGLNLAVQHAQQLESQLHGVNQSLATMQTNIRAATQAQQHQIQAAQQLAHANQQAANASGSLNTQQTQIASSISSIGKLGAVTAGVTASFWALKEGVQAVVDTTMQFDGIERKLEYAFGAENAAKQLEFVRETADKLGLELKGLGSEYGNFAAATKNMNITHEQTQQIFKGVASGAAAMGMTAEQSSGAFMALTQIASKGKVSMEELRGQLSEHMPAAMGIAAKAMGVTTAELENMVGAGLSAEEFLPKLGAAMQEAFGGQAEQNANSLSGSINKLKNEFSELLNWLGENGVGDAVKTVAHDISEMLNDAQDKLKSFADSPEAERLKAVFENVYGLLKDVVSGVVDTFSELYGLLNDVGAAIAGLFNHEAAQNFSLAQNLIDSLNIAVGVLRDAFTGLKVVFYVVGAAIKQVLSDILSGMGYIADKIPFLGKVADELDAAAKRMEKSSKESLEKAGDAVMQYGSNTKKAMGEALETVLQKQTRLRKETSDLYAQASRLAKEAADAQILANAAIGTASEATAKKQAEDAQKAATAAKIAADESNQAWQKSMGIEAPKAVETLKQKIDETTKQLADAKSAANGLGLDLQAAMLKPTQATQATLEKINALGNGFDALAKNGYQAGVLLQQALNKAVDSSANQADIEALRAKYQEFGESGKLSAVQVEAGFLSLDKKLLDIQAATDPIQAAFKRLGVESLASADLAKRQAEADLQAIEQSGQASEMALEKARQKVLDLKNAADPTADAFKQLGIKTKEALAQAANEQMQAFEKVKASGQATQADLQKAFEQTAQTAINSGDQTAIAWVQSQAAAYNYAVTVDATGKASLQAAAQTQQAADTQIQAHQQVTQAATESAQAQSQAAKAVVENVENVGKAAEFSQHKMSDLGSKVHETLKKMGAYATFGTASWANTLRSVQDMYININQTVQRLNEETENGGNIAEHLARAELMAANNARKLDKTTLNNLHQAIDKARQKMQQLADEAANARREAEKELLRAQGRDGDVQKLEQQEKLNALKRKQAQAQKTGNRQAQDDYAAAIAAQQAAYQAQAEREAEQQREQQQREAEQERERQQQQREAEQQRLQQQRQAEQQRQQQERERLQREAEQMRFRLPENKVDLSDMDWRGMQFDFSGVTEALAARDNQIKQQIPNLIKELMPQIAQELIKQIQKDNKRSM